MPEKDLTLEEYKTCLSEISAVFQERLLFESNASGLQGQ